MQQDPYKICVLNFFENAKDIYLLKNVQFIHIHMQWHENSLNSEGQEQTVFYGGVIFNNLR